MLHIAMLNKFMNDMLFILIALMVANAIMQLAVQYEEALTTPRWINGMIVLNVIDDASVSIDTLVTLPGIDFICIPRYVYYIDGKSYKTYSYKKCKRNSISKHRKTEVYE